MSFSWWILGSLVLYATLLFAAFGCGLSMAYDSMTDTYSFHHFKRNIMVSFMLIALVFNGLWAGMDALGTPSPTNNWLSLKEFSEQAFGFIPGESYPLELGAQSTSISGTINVSSGWFFTDTSASISGGTAVTVTFRHGSAVYALSLPRDSVTFHISETTRPTVAVNLSTKTPTSWALTATKWTASDCSWQLHNLLIMKPCTEQKMTVPSDRSARAVADGLGKLVRDNFDNAQITLTQSMYDQMTGRISK